MSNLNGRDQTSGIYEARSLREQFEILPVYGNQVSDHWDIIAPVVQHSLPEWARNDQEAMIRCLKSLMNETAVLNRIAVNKEIAGYIITAVQLDPLLSSKVLFVCGFYSFKPLSKKLLDRLYDWLVTDAKKKGCGVILAYTDHKGIVSFMESKGAKADRTVITLEV